MDKMLTRVVLRATLVSAFLVLAACRGEEAPTVPTGQQAQAAVTGQPQWSGLDGWLAGISSEVPAFGGLYFESGRLHVNLTDPSQRDRAAEVIRREFAGTALGTGTGLESVDVGGMTIHTVNYDFSAILRWKQALKDVLSISGVYTLDADERSNRVAVGVSDSSLAGAVLSLADSRGVPREAVLLKSAGPFEFRTELTDIVRPQGGGLQIAYVDGGVQYGCTIGFSASRSDGTDSLFVTASHCSPQMGVVDNTLYYQPSTGAVSTETGIEITDFPWQTTSYPDCPSGKECKVADALLARYRNASSASSFWVRGRIYRTIRQSSVGDTVRTIDSFNPYFTITSAQNFPIAGDTVHKVGRRTGWTSGVVTDTCVNMPVPNHTNQTLLCQDLTNYMDDGGDSGAPVFKRSGTSSAILMGVHSLYSPTINKRSFSSYGQVREELGLLMVIP